MPLTTFETRSHIGLYSPICLDWLASNVQGSSYICFPTAGITNVHRHVRLSDTCAGKGTQVPISLFSKHFANGASPSVHRVPQADLKFMIPLPLQHLLTRSQDAQSI